MSLRSPLLTIVLSVLLVAAGYVGQAKTYKHRPFLKGIEIGFNHRSEVGFYNNKPARLRFHQPEIFIRLPLSHHFKAEVCINREQFFGGYGNNFYGGMNRNGICVPASVQYYFLNPGNKIRPFVGMGGWLFATSHNGTFSGVNPEGQTGVTSGYRGPNFISVFYTQGITIEVNTHLQITPAMHFYRAGDANNVELTIGVGYRLP